MTELLRVSERYANYHPGYKLLRREDAVLPISKVTIRALSQEKTAFSPIDEFILRALSAGIQSTNELASMFGLEVGLVNVSLTELWQRDLVDSPLVDGIRDFRLTRQGEMAIAELKETVSREQEITIYFDRLLWAPMSINGPAMDTQDLNELTGIFVISEKSKRKLVVDDLKLENINRIIENSEVEIELLSVKQIVHERKALVRCDLLIFESEDAKNHLVDVAIDGRVRPEYGKSIEALGIEKHLGLKFDKPVTEASSEFQMAREVLKKISTPPINVQRQTFSAEVDDVWQEDSSSQPLEVNLKTGRPQAVESVLHRFVDTFEHPELLEEATTRAETRLLIISPWVKEIIVNSEFIIALTSLARRGVTIHIGYGFEEKGGNKRAQNNGNDKRAEERLVRFADQHPNVVLAYLGNTHAKILLWDRSIVTGSFNWLSFKGDKDKTYRQEVGTFLKDSPEIDKLWAEETQWIERQAGKVAMPSKTK